MELFLTGKRVIITGGSKGIGFATAIAFRNEGARVALIARDENLLKARKAYLTEMSAEPDILIVRANLSIAQEAHNAISQIVKHWDGIDVLVTNIGNGSSVPDPIPQADQFDQIWNVNFRTAEHIIRVSIPHLEKSLGNIVLISSIAGLESIGAPTDYSVAKAAIVSLSKNLARKLAPKVRVNCLAPGNVFFPGGSWDEKMKKDPDRINHLIDSTVPMKRFGKPEEIADSVLFLASNRSSFVTGSCLVVDGGQTVGFH